MGDWFFNFPAYLKVGISFFGILLLNRLGMALGFASLLFSLVLSLWSGTGLQGLSFQAATFARPEDYLLPIIIMLLLFFSEALSLTGRVERTMEALKVIFRSKKTLFIGLPALIGLLPMPGGAVFSAPLVASVDRDNEFTPPEKVAINYWFRHIWEYWWPIYPGVFLAIKYSGLSLPIFFLIQIPYTFAALLGGYFFILGKAKKTATGSPGPGKFNLTAIFSALGPITVLVVTALLGSFLLPGYGMSTTEASLVSMFIGLILAITAAFTGHGHAWLPTLKMFRRPNTWLLILLVISLQVFSAVLKCPLDPSGTTLVTAMRNEFIGAGIPLLAVIMLIPFISGLVTGVAFGFVGTSFPIVFALLGQNAPLGVVAAATALAYGFGYIGMMISPMHACFVVTCVYFQTPLLGVYRHLAVPGLITLLTAMIFPVLYYLFL